MGILTATQDSFKRNSQHLGLFALRLFSALVFAYTIALIGEGLLFYGRLSFWFAIIISAIVFMKVTKGWAIGGVLVLDLVLFLTGLLLRMYVLVAPGA